MLHPRLEAAFGELVAAWRHHERLRARRAPLRDLAESRARLDRLRQEVWRLRIALSPDPSSARDMAFPVRCPELDATVWIRWPDVEGDRYRCVCGQVASRPPDR